VLTLFELCPHPGHSPQRANDHVLYLDGLIRSQRLTSVDADDPEVTTFAPKAVPVVHDRRRHDPRKKCSCPRPPFEDPVVHTLLPSWASVPPWEPSWSAAEVEKEECRRLCWSALSIISCQSVTSSAFDKDPPDYFLSSPSNVSFPYSSPRMVVSIAIAVHHPVPWRSFPTRSSPGRCCCLAQGDRLGPALPKHVVME
jgi:hypothetical protein